MLHDFYEASGLQLYKIVEKVRNLQLRTFSYVSHPGNASEGGYFVVK